MVSDQRSRSKKNNQLSMVRVANTLTINMVDASKITLNWRGSTGEAAAGGQVHLTRLH